MFECFPHRKYIAMEWVFMVLLFDSIILTSASQGKICGSYADIGFVVDSSTSLIQSYGKEKDFVKKLANKFNISDTENHASVVIFSEYAKLEIPFYSDNTPDSFGKAVDNLPFLDSTTRIDRALHVAYNQMFKKRNGMRTNSKKVLILMTDGEQTKDQDAISPAEAIKPFYRLGVTVIILGIGSRVSKAEGELRSMVQGNGVLLFAANFDELRLDSFLTKIVSSARVSCLKDGPRCGTLTDVGFLMDVSGSLKSQYEKEKEFVKLLAEAFQLSKTGTRGGLISFSNVANVNIRFSEFTTLESFKNTVENLPLIGTVTRIDLALETARTQLFDNNNGPNDPDERIIFLLTDGSQIPETGYTEPSIISEAIRKSGIQLVIVGIGDGISMYEINKIAAGQSKVYLAKSPNDLLSDDFVKRIKRDFCGSNKTSALKQSDCDSTDIGLLLDSSRSLANTFQHRKEFVQVLAERFEFSPEGNHVGLVSFGEKSDLTVKFSDRIDSQRLKSIVSGLPILGETARLEQALRMVSDHLFSYRNGMRLRAHKILIILTGGNQPQNTNILSLADTVRPIHEAGIRVIVIAVGFGAQEDPLRDLVQHPSDLILPDNLNEISLDLFAGSLVDKACKNAGKLASCPETADLAFLLDTSTSTQENFDMEKFVIKEIADSFKISAKGTHVSLVIFSDVAELVFGFNIYKDITRFKYAVDQLRLMNSVTRTDLALEVANDKVFAPSGTARDGVPKLLLLLTDGTQTKSFPHKDPAGIAYSMRSRGIQFFVVGVGDLVSKDELIKIAGDERRAFLARTKKELGSIQFIKNIADAVCRSALQSGIN